MLFFVKVLNKKLGLTITSSCFCSVVVVGGGGGDGGSAADATGGVRLLNSLF